MRLERFNTVDPEIINYVRPNINQIKMVQSVKIKCVGEFPIPSNNMIFRIKIKHSLER